MITTLVRIIKYGLQSFWRNGWLSAATIVVMALALFAFQGLIIFNAVAQSATNSLEDKIDISVYFKTTAPEDDILAVERSLKTLPEVKGVEYISREKALEIFKSKHAGDSTIVKALQELNDNPLSASLNVKARDPKEYKIIAAYLENEKFKSIVDKVTYGQNQLAINRLIKIVDTGKSVGVGLNFALVLIAIIVTFNTVRLAIYSNREEIGVMRLVGGSNTYIRGPYVVEGILYGLIAAFCAFVIMVPIVHATSPYISVFIPGMDLLNYFYANSVSIFGYTLLLSTALGAISSGIAVTRYLRV